MVARVLIQGNYPAIEASLAGNDVTSPGSVNNIAFSGRATHFIPFQTGSFGALYDARTNVSGKFFGSWSNTVSWTRTPPKVPYLILSLQPTLSDYVTPLAVDATWLDFLCQTSGSNIIKSGWYVLVNTGGFSLNMAAEYLPAANGPAYFNCRWQAFVPG